MTRMFPQLAPTIFATAMVAACATPKRVDEGPITVAHNGDRVDTPTRAIDAATTQALESRLDGHERRDSVTVVALATCNGGLCDAIAQSKLVMGMTEAQVLAATRTTSTAWSARRSGNVQVMTPRDADAMPRTSGGYIAMVQFVDGKAASMTYREPEGLYVFHGDDDVTRNVQRAQSLVKQGDDLATSGDFTAALDHYDRASVINRADAEVQYKMATSLEKLLRPVEAELRYRMFLNQLEIQKIDAVGNANAKLAAAMVQARERLVVLEKK